MNIYIQFFLPMMLLFVSGILQTFYTYVHRGVYKDESAFLYFLNAIVFSYITFYGAYEAIGDIKYAIGIVAALFIIFLLIYYFIKVNRITVHNGPIEETMNVIEDK